MRALLTIGALMVFSFRWVVEVNPMMKNRMMWLGTVFSLAVALLTGTTAQARVRR
jgi:hypothetical protein